MRQPLTKKEEALMASSLLCYIDCSSEARSMTDAKIG
jgi:hypothetical protein